MHAPSTNVLATDVCDVSLGRCSNDANNTLCEDNDLCTIDYCDISSRALLIFVISIWASAPIFQTVFHAMALLHALMTFAMLNGDLQCDKWYQFDFSTCPVDQQQLCVNCKSTNSRIEGGFNSEQGGHLKLRLRIKQTIPNVVSPSAYPTEMITPFVVRDARVQVGSPVATLPAQGEIAFVHSGQFKLIPQLNNFPQCNEIIRGQITIQNGSNDQIYICLKTPRIPINL